MSYQSMMVTYLARIWYPTCFLTTKYSKIRQLSLEISRSGHKLAQILRDVKKNDTNIRDGESYTYNFLRGEKKEKKSKVEEGEFEGSKGKKLKRLLVRKGNWKISWHKDGKWTQKEGFMGSTSLPTWSQVCLLVQWLE